MSQQSLLHDAEGASGSGLYGTTREFDEIIRALNTYSIVAITDRRGVIVHVNDRFCEISKYERHELIGGTHRLINSGHHPKAYFQEMWRAIGRGEMWNGEICNRAKDGSEYWVDTTIIPLPDEQGRPERYIAIRTEETQRHFAEEQAHRLAFFDGLTGLPNHGSLVKTIGDCTNTQVTGELSGLMIVGIDDLSHVVEAFGYEVGNRLLLDAAERLGELCGSEVTLARNSAGTFGVLLPSLGMDECEARNSVEQFADEVFGAFAGETALGDGVVIEGSVSVGYVLWSDAETHTSHDEDGCLVTVDPYNVLNAANLARKQAARIGGHRSAQRFRSGMVSDSQQRLRFASELRRGMDRGELRLFSQPIVDRDRRVTGVEGLIRWSNPERGMVPPVDFIPLAEQTGLIVEIGEWVLHQACLILAEWQSNPQLRDLKFSINVSPRELHLSEFGDRVRGIVREARRACRQAAARGHRKCAARRRRGRGASAVEASRRGHRHGARRLRHGLLVAQLPAPAASAAAQDRPLIRLGAGRQLAHVYDRRGDRLPRPQVRPRGRGRGYRDRSAIRAVSGSRHRRFPGFLVQPARASR